MSQNIKFLLVIPGSFVELTKAGCADTVCELYFRFAVNSVDQNVHNEPYFNQWRQLAPLYFIYSERKQMYFIPFLLVSFYINYDPLSLNSFQTFPAKEQNPLLFCFQATCTLHSTSNISNRPIIHS